MGVFIVYLGFNNPLTFKRGVENVIFTQSRAVVNLKKYYIFFGTTTKAFKWNDIICISIKKDFKRFWELNLLLHFLIKREKKKPIIHSHNYLSSFFLIKKSQLFTIHDSLYYLAQKFRKKLVIKLLHYFIERIVYRRSEKLHFISKYALSQAFINKFLEGKVVIIGNTTPLESLSKKSIIENRKDENIIKIFSVRSIEERANIEVIIEAASYYLKSGMNIKFVIAGKGPLLSHYQNVKTNRNLSNLYFLGYVSDEELVKHYQDSDIVLVTAIYGEGFGLPIIEGYLFNKPVIASNVCAIPEVVISQEFLFDNSVESLIEKIDGLINTGKFQNGNFIDHYKENYSYDIVLKKYSQLYKTFINDL